MNEMILLLFTLLVLFSVVMAGRATLFIVKTKNGLAAVFATFFALLSGIVAYSLWSAVSYMVRRGKVDFVLFIIFCGMLIAFAIFAVGHLTAAKNGFRLTKNTKQMLVTGPSLFYALGLLATLRSVGVIYFEFFGTQKMTNTNFGVSFAIALVYFCVQYAGNTRNVDAKMAEVMTYAGSKRTGDSLREGFNLVPGVLPLFLQVLIYSFFRFSAFWGSTRGFNTSPIVFTGEIVAYTRDDKAVLFTVAVTYKIVDPAAFDNMKDDNSTNPRGQIERIAAEHFKKHANIFIRTCSWRALADGKNYGTKMYRSIKAAAHHSGLEITGLQIEWLGLQDEQMQRVFQEWAGRDIRGISQDMKAKEIQRLASILKRIDPSTSMDRVERIWESIHHGGRGSFKIS